jgi:type VI secretion system protein ImpL
MSEPGWRDWCRLLLRPVAALALGTWMAGLLVAAVQLGAWNDELVRTLLQIRADNIFRMRMAQGREPIPREWYRSKALALLAASEKMQDDTTWALFVPGSWAPFDNLRQRVQLRIERAFSDIAVETIRRELYFHASRLTGVPQDSQTAELLGSGDCAPPPGAANPDRPAKPGTGPQELPEYIAVENHLTAIEELDQAVRAMLALRSPAGADAENLRLLVRYTLGVELPGRVSRSVAFFRTSMKPEDVGYAAAGVPRLQQAARCSVVKAMTALDTRLFERNDLLASEAFLAQRATRLFAPGARLRPFAETVAGYREVIAALDEQEALLAHADYTWLHHAGAGLDPAHDRLLGRISRVGLLGPETVEQVRRQSGAASQRFSRQFSAVFGAGTEPAFVWHEDRSRLELSPQRLALRDGLVALLQEPFMTAPANHALPAAAPAPLSWDPRRLEQALAVADTRGRFAADGLRKFPPAVRQYIARFVDGQLAQLVQDRTVEAMSPASAAAVLGSSDPSAYRAQREQLARVQALLADLGGRGTAEKLHALVSRDLVERLALIERTMWSSTIFSDRTQHFGWWQGEGSPILQVFGAGDRLMLRYALSVQLRRLDEFGREAGAYLAYADPSIASSPTVLRWEGIVAELKRYRAGAPDSSLLALERYLLTLGPELNRANCVGRLAAATPTGVRSDEFGQRYLHIHNALVSRCAELRSPAAAPQPARAAIPFG